MCERGEKYGYDALERLEYSTKVAPSNSIITSYTYDAAGRRLIQTRAAGGISLTSSNRYDLAGRMIKSIDPAGLVSSNEYANGGRTVTRYMPGGGYQTTERYTSGQTKSVTGTGVIDQYYDMDVDSADNTQWQTSYTAVDNGPRWSKSVRDILGRTVKSLQPGFGGATNSTVNTYDSSGRISKTETTGQPDTLYKYDDLGNRVATCVDVDDDGVWDYSGPDRISSNSTQIVEHSGDWVRETKSYVYAQDNSPTATLVSTRREWLPVELGTAAASGADGISPWIRDFNFSYFV